MQEVKISENIEMGDVTPNNLARIQRFSDRRYGVRNSGGTKREILTIVSIHWTQRHQPTRHFVDRSDRKVDLNLSMMDK